MFHYMARLGRSKFAGLAMPAVAGVGCGGIYAFHALGHDLVEKLFGASHPDGSPVKLSDELRNMITEVHEEASKNGFRKDVLQLKTFKFPVPPIRWFATAAVEPFVVGCCDFATGVSIAVPSHYNYQKPEDLPDSLFEIKSLALFRSFRLTEREQKEQEHRELSKDAELVRDPTRNITKTLFSIDRKSDEGKEYISSLLLSDKAKRFSLMKELFYSDSWRPTIDVACFACACILASSTSRAYVQVLKLKDAHVSQRLAGYSVSALLAVGMWWFMTSAAICGYEQKAYQRTVALGELYKEGAREYYEKRSTRRRILGVKDNFILEFMPPVDDLIKDEEKQGS